MDYYKILEVNKNASQDEIKKAYRIMAKKYHPDKSTYEHADKLFARINEAYEVLGSVEKRRIYDGNNSYRPSTVQPPPRTYQRTRPTGSPRYKQREKFNLSPYIRHFKIISGISLIFCLSIILDYVLPSRQVEDQVKNRTIRFVESRSGRRVASGLLLNLKQSGSFQIDMETATLIPDGLPVKVYKTRILNKITKITLNLKEINEYYVGASIYRNFSFIIIVLFITSSIGSIRKIEPETALNLAVGNVIMTLISLYFVSIS